MTTIIYNYACPCGYHNTTEDRVQHGTWLRLLIDPVVVCPDCYAPLSASVAVKYRRSLTDEEDSAEQRETLQVLIDAGIVPDTALDETQS
jgi:hypothetical protein